MADSNTTETATTPSTETATDHGSEFSKPTGEKDDALWQKHFGKDAKDPKSSKGERASTRTSTPPRDESSKSSKSAASSGEKTPSSRDTSKNRTESSEKSTKPKSGKDDASSSTSKESKKPAESEATGQKTADETDPEAPSKKARDLYEQAKKTEDRREARKLYKRAMTEAFGEVPPEFDEKRFVAARTETAARKATLDEQAKKNEGRIQEAAEKLKPAIYVMRQLEGAKLADKLTVPMVERTISVMRALRSLEDGDFTQLAEVVAKASGVDHDEAMKRFVRGVKVSPEGKAARQAAEQAQRDNATLRDRLQALERQLSEKETTQTEAQKKAEQQQRADSVRGQWLDDIESELGDHPVLQLPRGKERVLAYLIKTAHPTLKTPRFSKEEAANRVVASERKRLQGARHLLDEGGAPAATPASGTRQLREVSRRETDDAGVRSEDPMARFGAIFDKHASGGRRR